jgi:hypothetical protein
MKYLVIIFIVFCSCSLFAQDNLMNILDSVATPGTDYVSATFKSTRIITGHSVESMKQGQLEFRISHRFGRLNTGADNLWGIDQSTIYLGLEYGVTDWLEIGIGRTPNEKTLNGFVKLGLLRQSSGERNMPVSISYVGAAGLNSSKWDNPDRNNYFSSRLSYVNQLLIARKFNEELSIQFSPTMIHRNLVPTAFDDNDIYALGLGARYKLSKRISVNVEYFYVLRPTWNIPTEFKNPLSVGFDIETGGHVFQLMLSNSSGMIEKHYIADNTGDWTKGDIHIGFNISRVFTLF